jgi:hypothetical protein
MVSAGAFSALTCFTCGWRSFSLAATSFFSNALGLPLFDRRAKSFDSVFVFWQVVGRVSYSMFSITCFFGGGCPYGISI